MKRGPESDSERITRLQGGRDALAIRKAKGMPPRLSDQELRKAKGNGDKITEEGQQCRHCGTPVVLSVRTEVLERKPGQVFYFERAFHCPNPKCNTFYYDEASKRFFDPKDEIEAARKRKIPARAVLRARRFDGVGKPLREVPHCWCCESLWILDRLEEYGSQFAVPKEKKELTAWLKPGCACLEVAQALGCCNKCITHCVCVESVRRRRERAAASST